MSEAYKSDPRFADSPKVWSLRLWIMMGLAFVSTFLLIRRFSATPTVAAKPIIPGCSPISTASP